MQLKQQDKLHALNQSATSESKLCATISEELHKNKSKNMSLSIEATSNHISIMEQTPSPDSVIDDIKMGYNEMDNETAIFAENGYKYIHKICDTLQGELFKAKQISNHQYVAIKKTNKSKFKKKIAIQNGINFCVSENIIKEALILKYLTIDNQCISDYIIKYINFFESDTDYFLVIEYIESELNLKQFVQIAHKYIENNKLKLKEYQKIIKYIHWQIAVAIYWLHDNMKCCHLDLCLENIMLQNCDFIEQNDGYFTVNPSVLIKVADFGVSEVFDSFGGSFDCRKQGLSLDNEPYLAPRVCAEELYDARSADMWSLGMILFECMTGRPLFKPIDICQSLSSQSIFNGYLAVHERKLPQYITMINNPIKYFNSICFSLLNSLLHNDQRKRINAINVLQHKWFTLYYRKYGKRIETESIVRKQKLLKQKKNIKVPCYIFTEY